MEQSSIERIRTATFSVERRGYDKREVEHFLNRIADWLETGGGDQAREEIVKRELERVGHHTAGLLASAQDGAEEIRAEAEERARGTRERADAYALQTREAAEREARRIVEEGHARRQEVETLISDLTAHRDAVAAEAARLAEDLREVSVRHAGPDGGRSAETEETAPAERVGA